MKQGYLVSLGKWTFLTSDILAVSDIQFTIINEKSASNKNIFYFEVMLRGNSIKSPYYDSLELVGMERENILGYIKNYN
jgi:hypothetical protein